MKKVVMKLEIDHDNQKQKAMEIVSKVSGVDSLAVDMKTKEMTVVGYADPVEVICKLRKSCHAIFVTVGPATEEKKDGGVKKT